MAAPRISNYEIMKKQMSSEFVKYDQEKMIRKFGLKADENYIYIRFVERDYRINRTNGKVTWSSDGFMTETEGDYNEAMTIYDVLCNSRDDCTAAYTYSPVTMLKNTVKSTGVGGNFFQKTADRCAGKLQQLEKVLYRIGKKAEFKGDVAAYINAFDFLPIVVQFWDADDEFSAVLKFMVDENIQDFMHFETVMFMLSHVANRICEEMEKKKVAFVCVHNSCRSQIAEALGRHLAADIFDSYSAGTETRPQINQDAVRLMKEVYHIDMEAEGQYSKLLQDIPPVDVVITMGCNVQCPYVSCEMREDWGLEDPTGKSDEEFLRTMQSIEDKVMHLAEQLKESADK